MTFLHHGLLIALVLVIFLVLWLLGRLPGIDQFRQFANAADTRGGNIAILAGLSVFFFCVGIGFSYYVVDLLEDKTITPDNTMVMLLIQWITGTAFGGTMGALIKTLNSERRNGSNGNSKPKP
jgi:hypothetical protein